MTNQFPLPAVLPGRSWSAFGISKSGGILLNFVLVLTVLGLLMLISLQALDLWTYVGDFQFS
jgi:hypothetical protein